MALPTFRRSAHIPPCVNRPNAGRAAAVVAQGALPARTNVVLGPVEIHRELMTAAARWIMAAKLWSVLSARMAMRLNSLSLQKKFSMRWRHLYISASIGERRGAARMLRDDDLGAALVEIGDDGVAVEGLVGDQRRRTRRPRSAAATPTVSKRCPGSRTKRTRLPSASVRARILVVMPPLERPMAWL